MAAESIWGQAPLSPATVSFIGTLATEFSLSASTPLTGIWIYSPSAATGLPNSCAIYDIDTSSLVSGTLNSSPSWSGPSESGWVKCSYNGSVTLAAGVNYATAAWFDDTVAFSTFTWPLNPNIIDATAALYTIGGSSVALPTSNAGGYTYYVDVEVTPVVIPPVPMLYSMRYMG